MPRKARKQAESGIYHVKKTGNDTLSWRKLSRIRQRHRTVPCLSASIDTSGLSSGTTLFANYGTTIAVGTPAEMVSVGVSQVSTNTGGILFREVPDVIDGFLKPAKATKGGLRGAIMP